MHRLIESSDPGEVTRYNVRAHYTQRLVLTASVCSEVLDAPGNEIGPRPQAALQMLSWWMRTVYDLPEGTDVDYDHGLGHPRLMQYANDLTEELGAGTRVCKALAMACTADHEWELKDDVKAIRARLAEYLKVIGMRKHEEG